MSDFLRQLKEQINIVDVIGEYVRLKKSGSNHMGLCPFHAERSPSFSVAEKKGIYHCFGCQKGGDAITFIQEIQAISFQESVRFLASRYQVKLPPEFSFRPPGLKNASAHQSHQSNEDKLEIYYKLNRFVAQFYHEKLQSAAGAREYLSSRGVSEETIKKAYLGYAPGGWAELYEFLVSKKAPIDKAEELGLIRRKSTGADHSGRSHYDLFRDRVMFPVTDLRGRVIAFGGRALGNADGPKYLNSSESPVFKKASHLFGLFSAQKEIRAEDACIIVEGFMDCLSLQQAGIGHVVATLGTALSGRQVAMLKRLTRNITLLFDGDNAGRDAQMKAMEMFLDEDVVVRGITLPDEYDPDEYVREQGADALRALLKKAPYILDQKILDSVSHSGGHLEGRMRAVSEILPLIAKLDSETARMLRIQELSGLFDVKSEALEQRIAELRSESKKDFKNKGAMGPLLIKKGLVSKHTKSSIDSIDPLDVRLVESFIVRPQFQKLMRDRDGVLAGLESETTRDFIVKAWDALAVGQERIGAESLDWASKPELKDVITRALVLSEKAESPRSALREQEELVQEELAKETRDLEKKLVRRGLERRKDALRAIILKAGSPDQSAEFVKLMSEYNELVRKLDETKGGQISL